MYTKEFIIILCMTVFWTGVFYKLNKNTTWKMTILFCNIGFYFYSGLGIAYVESTNDFVSAYVIADLVLNLGIWFGWNLIRKIYIQQGSPSLYFSISNFIKKNISILKFITYSYYVIVLFFLIYPENKLKYLFTGPNINVLFAIDMQYSNNNFQHLLSNVKMFAIPFVIAYFYSKNKKRYLVLYVFLDLMITFLNNSGYLGRRDIIIAVLLLSIYFYSLQKDKRLKNRIIFFTCLSAIPMLWFYTIFKYLRSGISVNIFDFSIIDIFSEFLADEASYPKHYDFALLLNKWQVYSPNTFWFWLFTLPIPKAFVTIPGYDTKTTIIYRVFSYHFFGGLWGDQGVGGVLPSILGEGIMLFGKDLSFIIMIPVALFIGLFMKFLSNIPELSFYKYTMLMTFLLGFRAGSQYILANINIFIMLLAGLLIIKVVYDSKRMLLKKS